MKNETLENPFSIGITGRIPFCVLWPDTIDENGKLISLGHELYTEQHGHTIVEIKIVHDEIPVTAHLFLKKCLRESSDPRQRVTMAIEDLFGDFSYSNFVLFLNEDTSPDLLAHLSGFEKKNLQNFLLQIGFKLVRKFIDTYRTVTEKHWISLPQLNRLSPWDFSIHDKSLNPIHKSHVDFRGTGHGIGSTISNDQIEKIREVCVSDLELDSTHEFWITFNRLKIHGDFQGTILYLAIYIESWVCKQIRFYMNKSGKSPKEVTMFFRQGKRSKSISMIFRDFTGKRYKDLSESKEFKDYRKLVADARNSIAHGTPIHFDGQSIEKAIQAGFAFLHFFQDNYLAHIAVAPK